MHKLYKQNVSTSSLFLSKPPVLLSVSRIRSLHNFPPLAANDSQQTSRFSMCAHRTRRTVRMKFPVHQFVANMPTACTRRAHYLVLDRPSCVASPLHFDPIRKLLRAFHNNLLQFESQIISVSDRNKARMYRVSDVCVRLCFARGFYKSDDSTMT